MPTNHWDARASWPDVRRCVDRWTSPDRSRRFRDRSRNRNIRSDPSRLGDREGSRISTLPRKTIRLDVSVASMRRPISPLPHPVSNRIAPESEEAVFQPIQIRLRPRFVGASVPGFLRRCARNTPKRVSTELLRKRLRPRKNSIFLPRIRPASRRISLEWSGLAMPETNRRTKRPKTVWVPGRLWFARFALVGVATDWKMEKEKITWKT